MGHSVVQLNTPKEEALRAGHSVVQLNTPKEEALRARHMWSNLTPRGRNSMGQTQCHLMKHPKGQTLWEETKHGPMKCP